MYALIGLLLAASLAVAVSLWRGFRADRDGDRRPAERKVRESDQSLTEPGGPDKNSDPTRRDSVDREPRPRRSRQGAREPSPDEVKKANYGQAVRGLRARVRGISEPVPIATLAHGVRDQLGSDAVEDWFGFGRFLAFLEASLPNAEIDHTPPAYLLPGRDEKDDPYPPGIRFLWDNHKDFPRLAKTKWPCAYLALQQGCEDFAFREPIGKQVYSLSKRARDKTQAGKDSGLTRNSLSYVAVVLAKNNALRMGVSSLEIENVFVREAVALMSASRLPPIELHRSEAWLRGYEDPHFHLRQE